MTPKTPGPSPHSPKRNFLADIWKEYGESFETEEDFQKTLALWPVCPDCGRRRTVRCPVCHHAGDIFPPADMDFWNGVDEVPGKFTGSVSSVSTGGSCRGASCGGGPKEDKGVNGPEESTPPPSARPLIRNDSELYPGVRDWRKPLWDFSDPVEKSVSDADSPQSENKESETWEAPAPDDPVPGSIPGEKSFSVSNPNYYRRPMTTIDLIPGENVPKRGERGIPLVTCPVCDEPFVPKYAPYCEECGHSFEKAEEGDETDKTEKGMISDNPLDHPSKGRIIAVIVAMAALTAAAILYCLNLGR